MTEIKPAFWSTEEQEKIAALKPEVILAHIHSFAEMGLTIQFIHELIRNDRDIEIATQLVSLPVQERIPLLRSLSDELGGVLHNMRTFGKSTEHITEFTARSIAVIYAAAAGNTDPHSYYNEQKKRIDESVAKCMPPINDKKSATTLYL